MFKLTMIAQYVELMINNLQKNQGNIMSHGHDKIDNAMVIPAA